MKSALVFAIWLGSIGFSLMLLSCSSSSLPNPSVLGELRILAIVPDNSEVNPSGTVVLAPWVSHSAGSSGTTYTYELDHCIEPRIAAGLFPSCDGNLTKQSVSGTISTLTYAEAFTGSANAVSVSVPASALIFAGQSVASQFNGIPYLVIYRVRASTGESAQAFHRVVVTSRTGSALNSSASLTDILADGASLASGIIGGESQLSAGVSGVPENFQVQLLDGSFSNRFEEFLISWFVTDGSLSRDRTTTAFTTKYKGPSAAPTGRKQAFVAVLRDGRGGVSVLKKSF